ncbi:Druantia anti-phage system protein DruA [uncultured Thermanaerothrix sp.]|uniref:Druantia anti-phage system protein DruA n=1 Tax=uncultured Thermanaerothrix sp. TaxID=1195149 RepID=UPI00262255C7|nr:Druantia anti-phage system protein DruA [uncultured Thermanaerothrix sp.]
MLERLKELGFAITEEGTLWSPWVDKERLRQIHRPSSQLEIMARQDWLRRYLPQYLPFFADGDEITPERIDPALVEVTTEQHHNLFRVARLLWSIPFSKGYGRRLRFLVVDRSNGKLIGLLALQSPPLSFPARDRLFRYPPGKKTELVNQTMDIQTLGAVPPYDRLLGGKLIGLVAASNEIRQAYWRKYAGRATEMEGRILPPHLVALTTTSAFGRSSLYNRLRYHGMAIAESLGYTEGYGTFHLMEFYPLFREFLESQGISTRGGFGTGPRRKWQTMVRALEYLGLPSDWLRHGVKREVFLFRLVENLEAYMEGRETEPVYRNLPFSELVAWWRERWLLPRAERVDGWREWRKEGIKSLLLLEQDKVAK